MIDRHEREGCIIKRIFKAALLLLPLCALLTGCSGRSGATQVVTDQVHINEVMSVNSYYAPLPDGSCCDWVEIHNTSSQAVNLKGCMLSDNAKVANKWKVPRDFVIEPDGYGLIYLSGLDKVDEEGHFHTNFKLSSKGETLVFSNAVGDVLQQLELPPCTLANISYGAREDGKTYAWFAEPSPGEANRGNAAETIETLVMPESGLIINEYMTKNTYVIYDGNNQYSDWIEIYNASENDVNLYGYALSDAEDGSGKWYFPRGASIGAGQYMVIFCTDMLSSAEGVYHANFKLSGGDVLTLYSIAGTAVDSVKVNELNPNVSCGRDMTDGGWKLFSSPTPGRANTTYSYELTAAVAAEPTSPLYVSEAMCVSASGTKLDRDFIELYNSSAEPVSLEGCALAKSPEGERFVFPSGTLAAGAYQVVYCTGTASAKDGNYTAPFKLNQGGEDVYLFDREGHIMDIFTTGKQTFGYSSGRQAAKKSVVSLYETPTPGAAAQGKTYAGYAPMPVFSSEGGYVESGFTLSITAPENVTVRYTTNGKEPTASSSVYKKPVTVKKSTVVKAVAFRDGYLPSETVSATFLVEQKHSIPVVSVSADPDGLFSKAKGIMSNEVGGLVDGQPNYESRESRYMTFEYYEDGKRTASFHAMARIFGETSRKEKQKALALILSEQCGANEIYYPFFGENAVNVFSALLLRPSGQDWKRAHMRDEMVSRLARGLNVDRMEAQPVALYINGEYWGLYYLREKLNEDYLVHKYGSTKGKIDIVKWERAQQAGSRQGYLDLCDYCETHDLSVKKNYDYVCSQVDIDSLIDWWIIETYVANNDTGNIRCWRDQNGGKWKWMLFDLDYAFSLVTYQNNYIKRYMRGSYHGLAQCNNALPKALLGNKEFREKFILRYFHLVKTSLSPESVNAVMDELAAEIADEMPRQEARWGEPTVSYWQYNMKVIRQMAAEKPEMAKQQMREAFGLSAKQVEAYYKKA